VQTKPRAEGTALEHLIRQGFECFLPRVLAVRLCGGHRRQVIEPLFPRYLFLKARPEIESIGPVRSTRGVLGLVRFGERIAEAPGKLVQRLINDADHHGVIKAPDNSPEPGDRVQILDGSLAGLEGIYCNPHGHDRAVVLLNLLGSAQRVVMPNDQLQRLAGSSA
jgi:transcriptional antiterminator RfaH